MHSRSGTPGKTATVTMPNSLSNPPKNIIYRLNFIRDRYMGPNYVDTLEHTIPLGSISFLSGYGPT